MLFRSKPLRRNWAVPPGDIIREYIECYNLTNREFGEMCGCSVLSVIDIVYDYKPLKRKLAEKFAKVVDIPSDALMRIEEEYREFQTRSANNALQLWKRSFWSWVRGYFK